MTGAPLAQVQVLPDVLRVAGDHGPVGVLALLAAGGLYWWFKLKPDADQARGHRQEEFEADRQRKAQRFAAEQRREDVEADTRRKVAEALEKLTDGQAELLGVAGGLAVSLGRVVQTTEKLTVATEATVECLKKVEACHGGRLGLSEDLGVARGALRDVGAGSALHPKLPDPGPPGGRPKSDS